jgi:hypothetical protein
MYLKLRSFRGRNSKKSRQPLKLIFLFIQYPQVSFNAILHHEIGLPAKMRLRIPILSSLSCTASLVLISAAWTREESRHAGECPRKHSAVLLRPNHDMCPSLTDDEYTSRQWLPWTHRPECIDATIGERGEEEEGEYCLYTSSFFGNHGVSIVTARKTAANAVGTLWDVYDSSFPSPETVRNLNIDRAYEVVDMPGMGKGVVASRLIKRQETFMVDYAILMTDVNFPTSVSEAQRRRLLRQAIEQLAETEAATGLARSGTTEADLVEDIMGTNSFLAELAGSPHKALFPIISVKSSLASMLST